MLRDALLAVAAVHAAPVVLIAQVIVAAEQRGESGAALGPAAGGAGSNSPLGELQVGRVVDHSGGFPIQSLSLQTKTEQKHRISAPFRPVDAS